MGSASPGVSLLQWEHSENLQAASEGPEKVAGKAIFPSGGEGSQPASQPLVALDGVQGGGWPPDRAFWALLGSPMSLSMLIKVPTPLP